MEILITNKQRLIKINPQRIKRLLNKALELFISEGLSNRGRKKPAHILASAHNNIELSILFVNDGRIKKINHQYRQKDKVTDVISFPQFDNYEYLSVIKQQHPIFLGDIVVNLNEVKRRSLYNKSRFYDEVARLLLHGFLHLLGYDHEKNAYQAKKMAAIESELFKLLTS
jgi:probable rRNA maturation factor